MSRAWRVTAIWGNAPVEVGDVVVDEGDTQPTRTWTVYNTQTAEPVAGWFAENLGPYREAGV